MKPHLASFVLNIQTSHQKLQLKVRTLFFKFLFFLFSFRPFLYYFLANYKLLGTPQTQMPPRPSSLKWYNLSGHIALACWSGLGLFILCPLCISTSTLYYEKLLLICISLTSYLRILTAMDIMYYTSPLYRYSSYNNFSHALLCKIWR